VALPITTVAQSRGAHRRARRLAMPEVPRQRQQLGTSTPPAAKTWNSTRSASARSRSTARSPSNPLTARTATLGGFVLIDRPHHNTIRRGMLHFALGARRTSMQACRWSTARPSAARHHKPAVVWFTHGISGAGNQAGREPRRKRLHAMRASNLSARTATTSVTSHTRTSGSPTPTGSRRSGVAEVARLMVDAVA